MSLYKEPVIRVNYNHIV